MITVDLREVSRYAHQLGEQGLEILLGELELALGEAADLIQAGAAELAPTGAMGILGTSISATGSGLAWEVGSPVEYALPVEIGRQPGSPPPISPLELWVRRKLGIQAPGSLAVASRLARAIGARGIQPRPFLGPAADRQEARLVSVLSAAGDRALDRLRALDSGGQP